MVVTTVQVHVKPEDINDFIEISRMNHLNSIKEPHNCRFDILQSTTDKSVFLLYEAYETAEDAAAHKTTTHYNTWRETVAPWMAEPRTGTPYTSICP